MIDIIDGSLFQRMVIHAAASIGAQKQSINELNVFPVPDGDTGTNMSLTIATAAAEAKKKPAHAISQAASTNASALLRGARGNSGVILSLLFRGVSKGLKEHDSADGLVLAAALNEGVSAAYKAVMKPAEGTILTVSRLAAQRAAEAALEQNSAEYVLEAAIAEGELALADTINQNPVLKKAGVVDAGGKGYLIILQGMLDELRGIPAPEDAGDEAAKEKADFAHLGDEEITYTFDTVFIVRKRTPNVDLDPFRSYLNGIGDSLVIGEDDESFKVHVHTDIPGAALTEGQRYGTLELAKIENMRTQAEDLAAGRHVQSTDDLEAVEEELEAMDADGRMALLPKKEQILLRKELSKLQTNLNGIRNMKKVPDAIFVIDTNREGIALHEAHRLNIPVVGTLDTNCDPDEIDYVIPGNDDAIRAVRLIAGAMANAIIEGREGQMGAAAQETEEKEEAETEA